MTFASTFRALLNGGLLVQKSKLLSTCYGSMYKRHKKVVSVFICVKNNSCWFSTQPVTNKDIHVFLRDGLPVVALPLPSKRDTCEFTLKPISQNVGDFTEFIKNEDGGVDRVNFFTKDGSRIAKSTPIDTLLKSEFQICINDETYNVSALTLPPLTSEDVQTITDVKLLVSQLHSTVNIESYQLEQERELQKTLEDLYMQITPLEQKTKELCAKANIRTNRFMWLGIGLMGLQFGILARLTWYEYSWDVMEPVTYFVTYGTTMAMFAYFLLTKQEYTYPNLQDRQFLKKFYKLAQKEKLDVDKYNQLREAITEIEKDLRRLRDPLRLHLPIKEIEKGVQK